MTSVLIKNGTIVSANGVQQADLLKKDGVIVAIGSITEPADETIDATGLTLFPGLIDCHVHFREPGFEHKATMASEAAAARAGGVTTVCEMPNTNPPTVTIMALADKVRRAEGITDCDIRFFFGITNDQHASTFKELWAAENAELQRLKARCSGVKLFLDHSTGNQKIDGELVGEVFDMCAKNGAQIIAHCEDPETNSVAKAAAQGSGVELHSVVRPAKSEVLSITHAIEHVRRTGAKLQIAHLSTKDGLQVVIDAKNEGLPVTCEVTPHHLVLSTDDYDRLGTLCKMNPPVRTKEDCQALWAGLQDGSVDCIATDHAPHTLDEKKAGAPLEAPSGVPGVETSLHIALTKLSPEQIHRVMFANPNAIFGLGKGDLTEGSNADIVLVDTSADIEIHASALHSKCGWTPYEGMQAKGKVVRVL